MSQCHFFYYKLKQGEDITIKDSFTFIFTEGSEIESADIQINHFSYHMDKSSLVFSNRDIRVKNFGASDISVLKISRDLFQGNNSILSQSIKENLKSLEIDKFILSYEDKKMLISAVENLKDTPLYKMLDENFDLFQLISIFIMLNNQIFKKKIQENLMKKPALKEEKLVDDIVKYLEVNIDKKISLPELEKVFFTNKTYLNELFNRYMHCSIGQYQLKIKMEKASFLLKDPNLSTIVIGEQLGFYDTAHFSKTFKKIIGKTPTEYRGCFI